MSVQETSNVRPMWNKYLHQAFLWNKSKGSWMEQIIIPVSGFWKPPVKISRDQAESVFRWRTDGGLLKESLGLQFERLWCLPEGSAQQQAWGPSVQEFVASSPPFSLHGFGEGAVLVLNDYKSEVGEKWKCLESCGQILEETRIHQPVQVTGRKQNLRQLRALESNIHMCALVSPEMQFFLSTVNAYFCQPQ